MLKSWNIHEYSYKQHNGRIYLPPGILLWVKCGKSNPKIYFLYLNPMHTQGGLLLCSQQWSSTRLGLVHCFSRGRWLTDLPRQLFSACQVIYPSILMLPQFPTLRNELLGVSMFERWQSLHPPKKKKKKTRSKPIKYLLFVAYLQININYWNIKR